MVSTSTHSVVLPANGKRSVVGSSTSVHMLIIHQACQNPKPSKRQPETS